MPVFTLWSKGRLVGQAKIMYFPPFPGQRCGDFEATEIGERLMPIMLGVEPATSAFYDVAVEARRDAQSKGVDSGDEEWPASVRNSTEYADMVSSKQELESLQLELRDSDGRVVPTEWIQMKDAEKMTAAAREIMLEEAAALGIEMDFDEPEPWEPKPPKYQIQVMLAGGRGWLSRMAAKRSKKKKRNRPKE